MKAVREGKLGLFRKRAFCENVCFFVEVEECFKGKRKDYGKIDGRNSL